MSSNSSHIELYIFTVMYFRDIIKSHCIFFKSYNNSVVKLFIFVKLILSLFKMSEAKVGKPKKAAGCQQIFSSGYFQP